MKVFLFASKPNASKKYAWGAKWIPTKKVWHCWMINLLEPDHKKMIKRELWLETEKEARAILRAWGATRIRKAKEK